MAEALAIFGATAAAAQLVNYGLTLIKSGSTRKSPPIALRNISLGSLASADSPDFLASHQQPLTSADLVELLASRLEERRRTSPPSIQLDANVDSSRQLREYWRDRHATIYTRAVECHQPLPPIISQLKPPRFCIALAGFVALGLGSSLALALWWSISHGDVSGGFTMGAYVVAAFALPAGMVGYRHSGSCRCWKRSTALSSDSIMLEDLRHGERVVTESS